MSRAKFAVGIILYILAFTAHLIFMYIFLNEKTFEEWQRFLRTFGGQPLPGTDALLFTLKVWWLYPLLGSIVFVYGLILRRRILLSVLFMTVVALLFAACFYGPAIAIGPVI